MSKHLNLDHQIANTITERGVDLLVKKEDVERRLGLFQSRLGRLAGKHFARTVGMTPEDGERATEAEKELSRREMGILQENVSLMLSQTAVKEKDLDALERRIESLEAAVSPNPENQ